MTPSVNPVWKAAPKPKRKKRRTIPASIRAEVEIRSGGRCEFSSNGIRCLHRAIHKHHRRLRSQGGRDTADNLADLCREHHDWAHAHPAAAQALGLIIFAGPLLPPSSAVLSVTKVEP